MLNKQKGFTLIELLVVIVVIGILIALTLPNLFAAQERARDTQRKNDLSNISQQLETYYNDNQTYPTDLATLETAGYLDEVPTDPNANNDYATAYAPIANDGGVCDGDVESSPCREYTITITLENENDADADAEGEYTQTSINQASGIPDPVE